MTAIHVVLLMDHILPLELELEASAGGSTVEKGDFLLQPYRAVLEYERGQAHGDFSPARKIEEQGELSLQKR